MRNILLAAAAAIMLAACGGTYGTPPSAAPLTMADAREGQRLAETYCVACHAIGETGSSAHPEAPPFRTFSRNYRISALEEAFAEGVLAGHPDMPEFRLEPDRVDALLAYIYTVQEPRSE